MITSPAIAICLSMVSTYFGVRILAHSDYFWEYLAGLVITGVSLGFLWIDFEIWLGRV